MQEHFYNVVDRLCETLEGEEVLLAGFSGEESDFVRFNQSKVRQAGSVTQQYLSLDLVRGQRHTSLSLTLRGDLDADLARGREALDQLRERLGVVPEDPYLLYATEVNNTEQIGDDKLPRGEDVVDAVIRAGDGRDLVGIFAQGGIYSGFANSLGQRNWFGAHSFDMGWSFYHQADKAVKTTYAGFEWDDAAFARKVDWAGEQLEVLSRPPRTIEPGEVRTYLAPTALAEFVGMLGGGFGLKACRTKSTVLLKMIEDGATLSPAVTFRENTREGIAPNFQDAGFLKPDEVTLIDAGRFGDYLVSPRSAKEYGEQVNSGGEGPSSGDMAAGDIPIDEVLEKLDTGVYANTLWYLNFSERPTCRITGMTRFATFWVEGGKIVAPLNVMRFDETAYRALGENLIGLTAERDFIPSSTTYGGRSTGSIRLPGALIDNFRFTL